MVNHFGLGHNNKIRYRPNGPKRYEQHSHSAYPTVYSIAFLCSGKNAANPFAFCHSDKFSVSLALASGARFRTASKPRATFHTDDLFFGGLRTAIRAKVCTAPDRHPTLHAKIGIFSYFRATVSTKTHRYSSLILCQAATCFYVIILNL